MCELRIAYNPFAAVRIGGGKNRRGVGDHEQVTALIKFQVREGADHQRIVWISRMPGTNVRRLPKKRKSHVFGDPAREPGVSRSGSGIPSERRHSSRLSDVPEASLEGGHRAGPVRVTPMRPRLFSQLRFDLEQEAVGLGHRTIHGRRDFAGMKHHRGLGILTVPGRRPLAQGLSPAFPPFWERVSAIATRGSAAEARSRDNRLKSVMIRRCCSDTSRE